MNEAGNVSLELCPDCGGEISPRAPVCPHCGAPRSQSQVFRQMVKPDWGFEWRSEIEVAGWPLIHVAIGRKNGKLMVAKGVIAIGQFAVGAFTIAQFGVGLIFGFGQFLLSPVAIAQFAVAIIFGLGQFATGYIAIGQFALGYYAIGQLALAKYIWTPEHCDPEARAFFLELARWMGLYHPVEKETQLRMLKSI